ncbi:UNVERIFIED_CONTAM: putative chlorophyll(ide) b reductase NYC1, chloroplastic [Sesamum calycinum]|uniref:Chlorophyll(Ide) b reductase NYC1, chloroplastic n=1 Tax=Sesamum calycinum TaxID=2727403 RepID=A0AAW2NSR9_9LAMI
MTTVAKLHLPPVDCRHQAGERPPPLHFLSRRLFLDPVCVKGRGRIWARPCRSFRSEEGVVTEEKEKKGEENCGEVRGSNGFGAGKDVNKFLGGIRNAIWRVSKPSLRSERKLAEAMEKLEETLFSFAMHIGRYIVTMLSTGVILLIGFQLSGGDDQMNALVWYSWLGGVIIGTMIGSNMVLEEVSRFGPRNVVITGSTRGLGKALAREFLLSGDRVVVTSRSPESVDMTIKELAENLKEVIIATGGSSRTHLRHAKVVGIPCDVSNPDEVRKLANFAVNELGSIDIWVNNAGTNKGFRPLLQFNDDDIQQLQSSLLKECRRSKVGIHTASPGMVLTDLLLSGSSVQNKQMFNIICELPETVARTLVPRMRVVKGSGRAINYLTPPRILLALVTAWLRRGRWFDDQKTLGFLSFHSQWFVLSSSYQVQAARCLEPDDQHSTPYAAQLTHRNGSHCKCNSEEKLFCTKLSAKRKYRGCIVFQAASLWCTAGFPLLYPSP